VNHQIRPVPSAKGCEQDYDGRVSAEVGDIETLPIRWAPGGSRYGRKLTGRLLL